MSGHVFVVHGDLTQLACDDWLLPTDDFLHVTPGWWSPALVGRLRAVGAWSFRDAEIPNRRQYLTPEQPVLPLADWSYDEPRPWLVAVAGVSEPIAPVPTAIKFVNTVCGTAKKKHLRRRSRRLLALPVVGTGWGGRRSVTGHVVAELLPALSEAAAEHDVDIALVTYADADFAAAQHVRRQEPARFWSSLPRALRVFADNLARNAVEGRLVLFLGAGVSAGAGLPDWSQLLQQLGVQAGLNATELARFGELGELDRAQYIAQRLAAERRAVGPEVVKLLARFQRYGLAHGLLAGLPTSEAVTTNYDTLFEKACEAAKRPVAVLPYAPATQAGRWLLKMHGCVEHSEDIVLTRQNYLRYAERNAALSGIVQAMLITKHMLFLGFSLRDDNFLRIVDQVRQAVRPEGAPTIDSDQRLGTALMLFKDPLFEALWRNEIDWVCIGGERGKIPETVRTWEVFLDYLSFVARSQSHLLDPRFSGALRDEDEALKELLEPLHRASPVARRSAAWPRVLRLLRSLGADVGTGRDDRGRS